MNSNSTISSVSPSKKKKNVVVIAGYGPSIGYETAFKFGSSSSSPPLSGSTSTTSDQYAIALLGRTLSKLEDGVNNLSTKGIAAKAYPVDCGNAHVIHQTIQDIRSTMGPIEVIVWNAASYAGPDLLATDDNNDNDNLTQVLHEIIDVSAVGIVAMVQASLPDLKSSNHGSSVLITGGGLSRYDEAVNQVVADHSWDGLALSKSIQRKLAGILNARLKKHNVFVGTVIISGPVRRRIDIDNVSGVCVDSFNSTDPKDVANAYWEMHQQRTQTEIHLGSLQPMINETVQKTREENLGDDR